MIRIPAATLMAVLPMLLAAPPAAGMTYQPFPLCTETARVDSLVDREGDSATGGMGGGSDYPDSLPLP